MTTYRLWSSHVTFEDITIDGWLIDALQAARMPRPQRVQFWDDFTGQWLNVIPSAVAHASQRFQQGVAA